MLDQEKVEIGKRLRDFGSKNFNSLTDFEKQLGLAQNTLTKYLSGKSLLGSEYLSKLIDLGCDINWLLHGKRSTGLIKEKGVHYVTIDEVLSDKSLLFDFPILADVPAGRAEINHHDEWPEYIKIDIDPREHFALRIDEEYGISMAPYIEPGDILFCSFTKKFNNGDIVVARYDGTKGAVKRIFINEQITLISFNPIESPIVINKKQLQQVFKVVLIWKRK
jgi:SOS-response transcriptional repressor LexA